MDNICDGKVIGRCGGDEKNECQRRTDKAEHKQTHAHLLLCILYFFMQLLLNLNLK